MWQKFITVPFKVCLVASICLLFLRFEVFAETLDDTASSQQISLRFAVPNFPPYAYLDENKQLAGQGVERVSKVLNNMGLNYELDLVDNYGTALRELRGGNIDGFFLATQNHYRDRIAKISDAVLINNWCWFYKEAIKMDFQAPQFKSQARIGTLLNTNTQVWLQDNDYTITTLSNDVDTLVEMLLTDRLDIVFLSESVFLHALSKHVENKSKIASTIESSRNFSVYFSNDFLAKHLWFLDAFNSELAKLKAKEKEAL
ncbi:substrate-binding periplasmic protein [Pseudoalteromonas sp.]|uniref:substrate-binding periplasmic protein n=1 Tax=Pseudoalteromonas sp. TaxID=53249 RepID=UPI003567B757